MCRRLHSRSRLVLKIVFSLTCIVTTVYFLYKNICIKIIAKRTLYILIWSHTDFAPFYHLTVKNVFVNNNCSFSNCYITDDKQYFGSNLSNFHAIAFNGRTLSNGTFFGVPRSPHQKFIYFNTESPYNAPFDYPSFDDFFNWTSTYRLDSDIPYPYILIKNSSGDIVGPKPDMEWREDMAKVDKELTVRLEKKKKWHAAVTFMSNCNRGSQRYHYIQELRRLLAARGYYLHIYGSCGKRKCKKGLLACDTLVEDYYFYLAFENSFAIDYVTEKVMRPLNHYAIPVVYGGANYSRFLPPSSYLNAVEYEPEELVTAMVDLIRHPNKYQEYFRWKKYYSYHDPLKTENVCSICAALNNKTKYQTPSVYQSMSKWWNT